MFFCQGEGNVAVKSIPEGFHTITPYLVVPDPAALIEFLEQAFDAKELHRTDRPDGSVMHVKIGDSMLMMGGATPEWPPLPAGIYLYVEDADQIYARAIAAGAVPVMEPMDAFWGDRMGGVRDASDNFWWIASHNEDVPREEVARRAAAEMRQK